MAGENKDDRDAVLRESYTETTKWLRQRHSEEFNKQRQAWLLGKGVEWTPPPTAEQKAEAELDALLAAHPELAEKVAAKISR